MNVAVQNPNYSTTQVTSTFGPVTLDYEDAFGAFCRKVVGIVLPMADISTQLTYWPAMTFDQFVTTNEITLIDRDIDTYEVRRV
jgi:hypothetical protein